MICPHCNKEIIELSPRQVEVLQLISEGNSHKMAADKLGTSVQTIKNHMTAIILKLHASNGTHAAVIGLKNKIIC